MAEPTEPLTPEEEAALRVLEITHRRRHWWIALSWSVILSVHTTIILHTRWHGWPLHERDLRRLALFVVHALLGGMITSAWHLRCVREHEAAERQWTRQDARWRAQDRVWRPQREESRRRLREGEAR
jgi:hypothetical protein